MTDFFKINKTYRTDLTTSEINDLVTTRLSRKIGLFTNNMFTGNLTSDGFNVVFFKKLNFFQIRLIAKTLPDNSGSTLNIKFKPTINPLFILIPIWTFFLFGFFAPSFTINGETATLLTKTLFILFGLFIFTSIILLLTRSSLKVARQQIESDLKLKSCVRRPDC